MSEPNELPPRSFPGAPARPMPCSARSATTGAPFAWKTRGLDSDAMRRTLGPSRLTLAGLVKHLALVEDHYFDPQLLGRDYPPVWAPTEGDDDWEWSSAVEDSPDELRSLWLEAVARSGAAVGEVLAASASTDRWRPPTGPRGPACAGCSST